ncbi:MAG: VWA domain-containing protein, partial [Bryobacteraceae bacterium]
MENSGSSSLSRRALLAACVVAIPSARRLFAAQLPPGQLAPQAAAPSPPVGAKLIEVLATVRDKKGKIVQNLIKDDFAISEDGQKEAILSFAQRSNLPLTLGLLVDTSGNEGQMLRTERVASNAFFFEALRPDRDQVFLIHFDREVELLQDPTSSAKRLHKALDELSTPQWGNRSRDESGGADTSGGNNPDGWGGGRQGQPGGQRRFRGGARLYDAIYLASNDLMKKRSGRKA